MPAARLTDFLNVATLQEIQDGYTTVSGLEVAIVDAEGRSLTRPSDCQRLSEREQALAQTLTKDIGGPLRNRFEVPIVSDGVRLGAIVLTGERLGTVCEHYRREGERLADRYEIGPAARERFITDIQALGTSREADAVRFVYLLADALAEVCRQEITLRQRVDELATLYELSTLLSDQRDLQQVLNTVARSAALAVEAKAASIRLLDADGRELVPKAVYNLSQDYLDKGPVLLEESRIDQQAFDGNAVYVEDMATDPRTLYPDDARHEGLGSILSVALVYRGRRIGVMRVYSEQRRRFSEFESSLLTAVAQLAAAAVDSVRLNAEREEAERVRRQVEIAADVQRRMLPSENPKVGPYDTGGRYESCFELGGDFYDFIPMDHGLGVMVGDVVGKGVAASLLMASVRAALRAHIETIYDLDEIMARANAALSRDTRDHEFATVFYGTLDARTRRLTYCSAGHDPALLYRDGHFTDLTVGGTVIGVDHHAAYEKGLIDLQTGDVLFVYTDGVPDAMNFAGEKFGRDRIRKAVRDAIDRDAQGITNHVLWEVRRFIGLNRPLDDMTLVTVKVGEGGIAIDHAGPQA